MIWLILGISCQAQAQSTSPLDEAHLGVQVMQITLGLAFVIAMIFLVAWVIKRFKLNLVMQGPIKTLAVTPLSHSSKMMLVELEGQQYLLGVTQQHVSLIDKLDQPVTCASPHFSSRLKQVQQS
tara:strand:- start:813 stop:1184 length:372 start_codon:yes stop_codon:yes gene_type:complete